MSLQDIERAIWQQAKIVFNNSKLRLKDILEWSTSEETVKGNLLTNEVMVALPDLGVWVAILKEHDKRE